MHFIAHLNDIVSANCYSLLELICLQQLLEDHL